MFGSDVLEVSIGLMLLFLMLSLVCTAVREAIEGVMKARAKDLERGIREMLDETVQKRSGTNTRNYTEELFSHPLVFSLFKSDYKKSSKRNLPSYIPAKNFSLALMDLLVRGSSSNPTSAGGDRAQPSAGAAASGTAGPGGSAAPGLQLSVESLRASLDGIENEKLRRAVLCALDVAGNDLDKVRANLEQWYDGTMDRVSGWYKRRTQGLLFLLALASAAVLNVDTITIAQRLKNDKLLRQAAIAEAEALSKPGQAGDEVGLNIQDRGNARAEGYDRLKAKLDRIGYPIGWVWAGHKIHGWDVPVPGTLCERHEDGVAGEATSCRVGPGALSLTVLGWFLSAFAVMLGAPFWFDVLNKFMVIRSTVKPHEKSPEEASEDRQNRASGYSGST